MFMNGNVNMLTYDDGIIFAQKLTELPTERHDVTSLITFLTKFPLLIYWIELVT